MIPSDHEMSEEILDRAPPPATPPGPPDEELSPLPPLSPIATSPRSDETIFLGGPNYFGRSVSEFDSRREGLSDRFLARRAHSPEPRSVTVSGSAPAPVPAPRPAISMPHLRQPARWKDLKILTRDGATLHYTRYGLVAHSDYFRTLFSSEMSDATETTVTLDDFDEEEVVTLLGIIDSRRPVSDVDPARLTPQFLRLVNYYQFPAIMMEMIAWLATNPFGRDMVYSLETNKPITSFPTNVEWLMELFRTTYTEGPFWVQLTALADRVAQNLVVDINEDRMELVAVMSLLSDPGHHAILILVATHALRQGIRVRTLPLGVHPDRVRPGERRRRRSRSPVDRRFLP